MEVFQMADIIAEEVKCINAIRDGCRTELTIKQIKNMFTPINNKL
jgi:hypothetical protein